MKTFLLALGLAVAAQASPAFNFRAACAPDLSELPDFSARSDVFGPIRSAESGLSEGGVGGGTHLLIGTALAIGGFWLMGSTAVEEEDNLANRIVVFAAPVALVGGLVEMGYGVYRLIADRNNEFR